MCVVEKVLCGVCIRIDFIYISSVYSPFSVRVRLPLHNIPSPGVLMKNILSRFFNDRMPFLASAQVYI